MQIYNNKDDFKYEEVSVSVVEATKIISRYIWPVAFLAHLLFFALHWSTFFSGITIQGIFLVLLIMLLGILVHELIHAFIFGLFAKGGFKNISFGIDTKTYSPYCHCKGEITVAAYRAGAIAPLFIMGAFPFIFSFFNGSLGWFYFGLLYLLAAGGDVISVYLTKGLNMRDIIKDHDAKLGYYIIKRVS
ncbi:DUF3267 domain-containing protein [Marinilabiliaceae bacterium ANBcel2]|nr:DUF3267 domain-containing protein [Marinilabiliaceae bacterium ANBcel2]